MAVKIHIVPRIVGSGFLSRLCGGEGRQWSRCDCISFLSRLCGGEVYTFSRANVVDFLSRLCGGEVSRV